MELLLWHEYFTLTPSDINGHLPTLRKLACGCCSIAEIGLRNMVSTWALLLGLSENKSKNRSYLGIDLISPPPSLLSLAKRLSNEHQITFRFRQKNDLYIQIKEIDLLFIDSLHTYCHLTYELEKFSPKVTKWIALHDTSEPWGECDDSAYPGDYTEYPAWIDREKKGLWPAVKDFLARHPEWGLKERRLNHHGLTILERSSSSSKRLPHRPPAKAL